jgi:hypothetical protein
VGLSFKPSFEAGLALMEGDNATVRERAREAWGLLEKAQPQSDAGKRARLEGMSRAAWFEAMAALGLRDLGEAELAGRRAAELAKQVPPRTPLQAFERIDLHVPHAIALARLGRHAEARAALEPVKKHFADPKATGDSPGASALLAWSQYAEALATPERAQALLAEAARRIDATPAEMRRLKTVSRVREDIAREAASRR